MQNTDPEFITCAMEAVEEGIRAEDIQEECACRLGYSTPEPKPLPINPLPIKE